MMTEEVAERLDQPSERKEEGVTENEESLVAPPNRAATSQIQGLDLWGGGKRR
ncbi:hypothetical protein A2U01_0019375, partial [Trifolium medium]|nr:hypothetical protein [Trifolium medium]